MTFIPDEIRDSYTFRLMQRAGRFILWWLAVIAGIAGLLVTAGVIQVGNTEMGDSDFCGALSIIMMMCMVFISVGLLVTVISGGEEIPWSFTPTALIGMGVILIAVYQFNFWIHPALQPEGGIKGWVIVAKDGTVHTDESVHIPRSLWEVGAVTIQRRILVTLKDPVQVTDGMSDGLVVQVELPTDDHALRALVAARHTKNFTSFKKVWRLWIAYHVRATIGALLFLGSVSIGALIASAFVGAGVAWVARGAVNVSYFGEPKSRRFDRDALEHFERRAITRFFAQDHAAVIKGLFPKGVQAPHNSTRLKVGFPPAPREVTDRMLAAAKAKMEMTLYVAADAIAFLDDPARGVARERGSVWKERQEEVEARRRAREAERAARRLADPIVVYRTGDVVAVIAQYGDFPSEEAVMAKVLGSSALV